MVWRLDEFGGALRSFTESAEAIDAVNRHPDLWPAWMIPANGHTPDWTRRVFCRLMEMERDNDRRTEFSNGFKAVIRLEPDYDTIGRWFVASLIADRYTGILGAFDRSTAFDEKKALATEEFARSIARETKRPPKSRRPFPENPLATVFSAKSVFPGEEELHESEKILEWIVNLHQIGLVPVSHEDLVRSFAGNLLRSAKYALLTPTERRATAAFARKGQDGVQ